MLELSCKAFAPPAPRLSLVQEIVRDTMRHRFPGAQLRVKSWPSLLQRHEQAAEAAEQWEPEELPLTEPEELESVHEMICEQQKDEGCLREQRAAMSRLMVAKLYQASESDAWQISCWLSQVSNLPQHVGSLVAAGAPHGLEKVLRSDIHDAKADAAGALASIAEQYAGAVVSSGAIEAWVAVLQMGTEYANRNALCALWTISKQQQHVGAVVAADAIEASVAVLLTGLDDAKPNAAATLARISYQEQHVGAVVAAGAAEACVAVLKTGPEDAKCDIGYLLTKISYQEQHVKHLVAAGVITALLDMMHSMDSDEKIYAALPLANFSDRLDVAVVSDVVATLVSQLQTSRMTEIAEFDNTRALSRIVRHKQHVDPVVAGGAMIVLIRVQQNGSQRVKNEASVALDLISATSP